MGASVRWRAAREAAHFLAWWRPPAQLIETSACARFSLTAPPMEPPELAWQRERARAKL